MESTFESSSSSPSPSSSETIATIDTMVRTMQKLSWPDYAVFGFMLISCSCVGIKVGLSERQRDKKRRGRQIDSQVALEYLVGGRKMKVFPVAMSLIASFVSGIMLLGTSTEIYVYGMQYMYILVAVISFGFVVSHIFLPVFHEMQLTSTYEYLETRFDRKVRLVGSILYTIGCVTYLPICIYVPALAFNQVTGVNVHVITPIVCLVCIFYTCVGGLKAVIWTDVIQTVIMYGSLVLIIVKATINVGGIGIVFEKNWNSGRIEPPDFTMDPYIRHGFWSLSIGGFFYWLQGNAVNQGMIQRYLSLPDLQAARRSLLIYIVGVSIMLSLCVYNGFLLYATYSDCDPLTTKIVNAKDQLLPLLVVETFKDWPGMTGLFVAGVFSAALSSLSTSLNAMAAIVLEDFYKPYSKRPLSAAKTKFLMRLVVCSIGFVCVGLVSVVEKLGTVLELTITLQSVLNGPLLGVFLMGLLMPWVNSNGALTGAVCGILFMTWKCIQTQAIVASGRITFPVKMTSVLGCTYRFVANEMSNLTAVPALDAISVAPPVEAARQMSYLWYTLVGCSITIGVGLAVTVLVSRNDPRDLNPALLAPCVRRLIKARPSLSAQPDLKERECIIMAFDEKISLKS